VGEWTGAEVRAETSSDLEHALEGRATRPPNERVHLVHGIAHEVLPERVQQREMDLVIMGTLGREGERCFRVRDVRGFSDCCVG
jgi:nucleotide-binding universal stress UspA family protein